VSAHPAAALAPAALEAGVQRVMVVCCPDLGASEPDPAAVQRSEPAVAGRSEPAAAQRFEQVIAAVTGFCPRVEAVEPGVCAFGARGPARYFGGETVLARKIIAALADLGEQARIGAADGLFAALLAARGAERILVIPPGETAEFLARQPVSVLAGQVPDGQELAGLLSRLGLPTLGDLAALPVGDVAGRFGAAGEAAGRLARGLGAPPLAVRPPAEDLSVTREFDPPETLAEPVVFAAKALAERLHGGLAARGLTCVRVQVEATWADGRESRRLWRHDGLLSAAGVADRVRWQLDGWRAVPPGTEPPGPGPAGQERGDGGVAVLRLAPDHLVRATGHQLALWGEAVVTDAVARAAMRVQALLGHQAVLRPVVDGGRNVCDQVTLVPFGEKTEPRLDPGAPWPGRVMGPAPAVVYPFAREADVTDDSGAAVTVSGRCVASAAPAWLAVEGEPPLRVTGWAGPWPLSERWWDPAAARRRARFQLLTGDGRAWLAAVQDGRWLIEAGHGLG
jgi:protein ImuB